MTFFEAALIMAAFLCSLVAGFLFAFAAVVMPGLGNLDDEGFIRAFQAIDRVIQNNQPLFVIAWVGSIVAAIAAAALGAFALAGADRALVVVAALVYLFGVQVPTIAVNIPLNNQLQRLDVAAMPGAARAQARGRFEPRWNRWNAFRSACAGLVSGLLLLLLLRA